MENRSKLHFLTSRTSGEEVENGWISRLDKKEEWEERSGSARSHFLPVEAAVVTEGIHLKLISLMFVYL